MSRRLRLGIVGAGRVGQIAHLDHYAGLSGLELALADIRPQLLAEVADRYGIKRRYADHRALLAAGVDAVVVVVRRPATGPVVLDALAAGCHVLSEKPMALTYCGATALVDAARRANVRYGVAYMKRCDAGVAAFKKRFAMRSADGRLGELVELRAWSWGGHDGSRREDFAMTPEARPDGLSLWAAQPEWLPKPFAAAYETSLNVHSHMTNLVRWIVGPTDLRNASRGPSGRMQIDALARNIPVSFDLQDGNADGPWREGVALRFTAGELRLDLPAPFASHAAGTVVETAAAVEKLLPEPDGGAFARQAQAFVAWVRGEAAFVSPGEDALIDIAFADAAWRRITNAVEGVSSSPDFAGSLMVDGTCDRHDSVVRCTHARLDEQSLT